jgi:hypothetical protein
MKMEWGFFPVKKGDLQLEGLQALLFFSTHKKQPWHRNCVYIVSMGRSKTIDY